MNLRSYLLLLAAGMLAAPLNAQQGKLAGPLAGYVFDSGAQALRPVLGIPGASIFGPALSLPFAAASVTVSPRLDSAVAVAADGSLHILRLDAGTVAELIYNSALGTAQRVAFSPNGTAAALISGNRAEIVTGLPDAPQLSGTLDLGSSRPERFAVSDDGAYLLAAAPGTVRLLSPAGSARTLVAGVRNALVAFAPGSHDAAILTPAGGLALVRDVAGTNAQQVLAATDDAFSAPAGVAFSADAKSVLVASSSGMVANFDIADGARSAWTCGCTPTDLARMGNTFRLNEAVGGPLWLLDTLAESPRMVFVPAPVTSAQATQ
jgi:hypothetical protein